MIHQFITKARCDEMMSDMDAEELPVQVGTLEHKLENMDYKFYIRLENIKAGVPLSRISNVGSHYYTSHL